MTDEQVRELRDEMRSGFGRLDQRLSGLDQGLSGLDQGLLGLDQRVSSLDQRVSGLDQRLSGLDQRLSGLDQGVSSLDQRVSGLDQRLSGLDQRLSGLDQRLSGTEGRLTRRLANLEGEVVAHGRLLERLDTRVHQLGLLQEERHGELKLAIEQFQMVQQVSNAKLDLHRDSIEHRLDPIELASRHNTGELERHDRRITTLEASPTDDGNGEKAAS